MEVVISTQGPSGLAVAVPNDLSTLVHQKGINQAVLEDLRRCMCCFREVDELKVLSCQHSLCDLCLKWLPSHKNKYKCPVCLMEFATPNGGFDNLPDNIIAQEVVKTLRRKRSGNVTCEDLDLKTFKEKLSDEISSGKRWLQQASIMILLHVAYSIENRRKVDTMRMKIQEYAAEIDTQCAEKISHLTARLKTEKAEVEERMQGFQSYIELRKSVSEVVQKLKDAKCSSKDFKEAQKLLESLSETHHQADELQCYLDERELKRGDPVRLKQDLEEELSEFIRGEVTHSSTGILLDKNSDGKVTVIFPEKIRWKGNIKMLEKSFKRPNLPFIGDKVKIWPDKIQFDWNGVRPRKSQGILKVISSSHPKAESNDDLFVYVDFPEVNRWEGLYSELLDSSTKQECKPLPSSKALKAVKWNPEEHNFSAANPTKGSDVNWVATTKPEPTTADLKKPTSSDRKKLRSCLQGVCDSGAKWCKRSGDVLERASKWMDALEDVTYRVRAKIEIYCKVIQAKCERKIAEVEQDVLGVQHIDKELTGYAQFLEDHLNEMVNLVELAQQSTNLLSFPRMITPRSLLYAQMNFYRLKFWNSHVRRIEYGVDSFWEKFGGDCIMINAEVFNNDSMHDYLKRDVPLNSVGILMKPFVHEEKANVLFPGEKAPWMLSSAVTSKMLTKRRIPFIGDKVRLKTKAITLPTHSDDAETPTSALRGSLIEMFPEAVVRFPGRKDLWKGSYTDIELFPGCGFERGDKVRVKRTIPEPFRGWGGTNGSSVGKVVLVEGEEGKEEITVDFPECKKWVGPKTDLEMVRDLRSPDEVQVKLTVSEPRLGWQSINHDDKGYLRPIKDGDVLTVGFERQPRFNCYADEIELCRYSPTPYDKSRPRKPEEVEYTTPEDMCLYYDQISVD